MKALVALAGCLTTTVSLLGVSWCHCCHLWGQVRCAPHPNHQREAKGPREARSSCAARETRRGRRPGPDPSPAPHGPHTPPPAAFAWHPAWLGARARWIKAQAPACGRQAPSYSGPHLAGCPASDTNPTCYSHTPTSFLPEPRTLRRAPRAPHWTRRSQGRLKRMPPVTSCPGHLAHVVPAPTLPPGSGAEYSSVGPRRAPR